MPLEFPEVEITPAVLRWARESAGLSVPDVASRLGVEQDAVNAWEEGGDRMRLSHLKEIARLCRRPLSALLLSAPPGERPRPKDFRVMAGASGPLSRDTLLVIRRAHRLQEVAADMMADLGADSAPLIGVADLNDDPEDVAAVERQRLGIDVGEQGRWRNEREALRRWRAALERLSLPVFQFAMPDLRGFSLADREPYVIVVNRSDAPHGRIFTLMHEYGHLLLRRPGVCDVTEAWFHTGPVYSDEVWCNRFAASFLAPAQAIRDATVGLDLSDGDRRDETISKLSRRLKVSREVVRIRLVSMGLLADTAGPAPVSSAATKKGKGPMETSHARCLHERGRLYVSLVLDAAHAKTIPTADVCDFLAVKATSIKALHRLLAESRS
jgi:Zn-dependent peptidase ImmA (M78 family)/DNA-binding XRE family transcriptional regulator